MSTICQPSMDSVLHTPVSDLGSADLSDLGRSWAGTRRAMPPPIAAPRWGEAEAGPEMPIPQREAGAGTEKGKCCDRFGHRCAKRWAQVFQGLPRGLAAEPHSAVILPVKTLRKFGARLLPKSKAAGGRLRSSASTPRRTGRDASTFDPSFYRRYYADLGTLPDDKALRRHYLKHGRSERRYPNSDALILTLEAERGGLPHDFIPEHYRALHADLASMDEPWRLEEHYLRFGRREGRIYKPDLEIFERDYERMVAGGLAGRDRGAAPPRSFAHLLASARVLPGPWLGRFMLHEFVLLNAGWLAHPPASRMEGLYAFLTAGLDRLAPIAMRLRFDPDFYRARAPEAQAGLADADLYRHWLWEGSCRGEPGTEAEALVRLLGDEHFPAEFDEVRYRARLPESVPHPAPGRFEALSHFVKTGFALWELEDVRAACSPRLLEQIAEHHLNQGNAIIAKEAYDRALRVGPGSGHLHHRLGDALRMLNRTSEATQSFAKAADIPGATVWSHIHALDGLSVQQGGTAAALDYVRRHAADWCGSPLWRAAAHRAIAHSFAAASGEARGLYAAGRRREADEHLTSCLDRIVDLIRLADPLPAALPVPADGPVVLIANRDLPQCDHYRVAQKIEQLEHGGWTVEVFGQSEAGRARAAIDRASAVVFYRVAAFPEVLHAILYARALGLPTIYEVDDLIFDQSFFPDPLESFEGQITPEHYVELQYGVPLFRYAMRNCDIGLASTPALADRMRPLVRSGVCHVLRNGLDARNLPFLERPHRPLSDTTLTIFYGSGTRAHNRDFNELAAPALLDVLARHPEVRLVIAGYLRLGEAFRPFAHRVVQLGFSEDVSAYWEVLSGADINLAILAPGEFADAKSEIKWLEAAMCGIPSIVSATRTYREILADGRDALMVETVEEWRRALSTLIADPERRRAIGAEARVKALASYDLDAAVRSLRQVLTAPLPAPLPAPTARRPGTSEASRPTLPPPSVPARGKPPKSRNGKPRVLVVNVFFPPQTIGGATRVVRDNIDHILDHAADRFEIAVAAADHEAETPYRTRIQTYRGLPVFRIATPREPNMDWRPFNSKVGPEFERLLDRFDPDLVHFHCVQQLTATVVEAVRDRGIPYVVTLHDAWWISDFQFLTDEDGQVRHPSPDPLADATSRSLSPIASLARRRALGRMLEPAAAIAAVSETFAEIYRTAGFPRTIAIPNGVPQFARTERRPNRTGRVHLGHIGGRSAHKGATLVEAVLRAGRFDNLSLTLVDHAFATDQVIEQVWGTTPVRIVGKVPQERICELYAELDVLLAPSLWPESFGLVAREAQAAGLWVVAGDRGAIGDEVVDGVNGFRVDVSSPDGLRAALERIDADPRRFLESPPPATEGSRTAADQGDDLIALYDRLLSDRGRSRG